MTPLENFDDIISDFKNAYQNGKINFFERRKDLLNDWIKIRKQKEEINEWIKKFNDIEYGEMNQKAKIWIEKLNAEEAKVIEYFGDSPDNHPEWFEDVEQRLTEAGIEVEFESETNEGLRYVFESGEIDPKIDAFSDFCDTDIDILVKNLRQCSMDLETSFGNFKTEELRLLLRLFGARARLLQVLMEMDRIKDTQRQMISGSVTVLRTILKSSPMVGFIEPFHSGFKDKMNWLDYVIKTESELREFREKASNETNEKMEITPEDQVQLEEARQNNQEKKKKKEDYALEKLEELKAHINGTYLSEDTEAQMYLREQVIELMDLLGVQHIELLGFAKEFNQYLTGSEFRPLRRIIERESSRIASVGELEILEYEKRLAAEENIGNNATKSNLNMTTQFNENKDTDAEIPNNKTVEQDKEISDDSKNQKQLG